MFTFAEKLKQMSNIEHKDVGVSSLKGTPSKKIYIKTSTEAVYNPEGVTQEYINNHVDGSKIVDGTVTNSKIANGAVSMNKLDNETQTLIQRGADSSWTPMGDYDVEALYYANDLVFDPETNSSYLSLRADNMGHAVTDETWWMKVVDGSVAEEAAEVANEAAQAANTAAANAEAKIDWVEEQVESLVAYEVDDELDEESIIPVQNKVIAKELDYLKKDVRTLAVGQNYENGESAKTSGGKLIRLTQTIKSLNLTSAFGIGELKTYSGATYKALKAINEYDESVTYESGDYAIVDDVIKVYDGEEWTAATLAELEADTTLFTTVDVATLESAYTTQNSLEFQLNGGKWDISSRLSKAVTDKYIVDGVATSRGGSFITTPIELKKNDKITIQFPAQVNSLQCDFISYVDTKGAYHTLYKRRTNTTAGSVSYTLQEDYTVVFSFLAGTINTNLFIIIERAAEDAEINKLKYKQYCNDWIIGIPSSYPSVGATFAYDNISIAGQPSGGRRQLIRVKEGERYVISTLWGGNDNKSHYWIVNENDVVIANSSAINTTQTYGYEIVIPAGAKYLVVYSSTGINYYCYKRVAEPVEDIVDENLTNTHVFINNSYSKVIPNVGSVYTGTNLSSSSQCHIVPVMGGEEYQLTAWLHDDYFPGYAILSKEMRVIQKVSLPTKNYTTAEPIVIPTSGCWLIFNVARKGESTLVQKIVRTKRAKDVVDMYKYKEASLVAAFGKKTTNSNDTYTKRFTMTWATDTHYDIINYRRWVEFTNHYKGYVDAALHTGDFNYGCDADGGFNATALKYRTEVPFVPCLGNHDSYAQTRKGTGDALNSGSKLWNGTKYILPFMDSNCVSGEDYCYYYRDFAAQKIRIIAINDYDKPRWADGYWITTTDEEEIASAVEWTNGTSYTVGQVVHYKDLYLKCKTAGKLDNDATVWPCDNAPTAKTASLCRYLDQAQVDFVINAMNVQSGWSIIFIGHQSLERVTSNTDFVDEAWNSSTIFTTNPIEHKFGQNGYILQDLITAYLNRTTLQRTYECITPAVNPLGAVTITNLPDFYPDVEVDVDFSSAVGDVICYLNGHQHSDTCYYSGQCGNLKLLTIGCTNGGAGASFHDLLYGVPITWGADDLNRGCDVRDTFNVISFDTEEKAVYLVRIGADITNKLVKRDYIRISYAH